MVAQHLQTDKEEEEAVEEMTANVVEVEIVAGKWNI